jgi:hypothetical protein
MITLSQAKAQDWINFEESIPVRESCNGTYVKYTIPISYYNDSKAILIFKESNIPSLKLFFKGNHIEKGEVFKITNHKDLRKISFDLLVNSGIKDPHLVLTQIVDDQVRTFRINIFFGCYPISSSTKTLNISDSCQDSVTLLFPFQGTQTDSYLTKLTDGSFNAVTSSTYYCCRYGNGYKISKKDLSKFNLHLIGCYSKQTYSFETK